MATETMNSDTTWPAVGNPQPPMVNEDPNPEWEMIAETEEKSNNHNVVIFPRGSATETVRLSGNNSGMIKGRPRSATIGGPGDTTASTSAVNDVVTMSRNNSSCEIQLPRNSTHSSNSSHRHRTLRRCASTPDLLMSDNAHEVIVVDESDEEDGSSDDNGELVEAEEDSDGESFEVLSSDNHQEEPVMIMDEDNSAGDEEESGTLVSTPSIGTSSWTMASTPTSTSVWGMTKSPSFADILSKNLDENTGVFGKDKAHTEAKLRDSHRRHHLRVRTKPKFIVSANENTTEGKRGMMKHAHSTGDLSKMMNAKEEGHDSSHRNTNRRVKKQLSAMMEEDEEGDFVIGKGSGAHSGGGGGGGFGSVEVMGDTDAVDYYHRKEHGSKSTSNKKKERPDEAKRREIIMHKKEMQRKKQAESQKGGGSKTEEAGGGKKKKKNDKGFGGKKERRQR